MLLQARKLMGRSVRALDGSVGHIASLYFDCERMNVRYFAVETGGRMNRRDVLIPTPAVPRQDFNNDTIYVNLSQEQIRNSPDIDINQPIPRETEGEIARYFSAPLYWEGGAAVTGAFYAEEERLVSIEGRETATMVGPAHGGAVTMRRIPGMRNLYSARDLLSYHVQTEDGESGSVEDLLIDDSSWNVRYLQIDEGRLAPGKKILLSPRWIDGISDEEKEVRVSLTQEALKNSPAYNPDRGVSSESERQLDEYYDRSASFSPYALWRFNYMRHDMVEGKTLHIETRAPALIRWTADEWHTTFEARTTYAGGGVHAADLPTYDVTAGRSIHFTFFWPLANHWEGKNYSVHVAAIPAPAKVREMAAAR